MFTHGVKPFVDADGNLKESYFKGLAIEKLWKDDGDYKVIHIDFSTFDTDTTFHQLKKAKVKALTQEQNSC